jgi:hypothetical protein
VLRQHPAADAHAEEGSASAAPEVENYRYYLRAAVLIGVLAGAALGTLNLTWIAAWGYTGAMPRWEWWPALIQAHGNAQLFGWTGLFIIRKLAETRIELCPCTPPCRSTCSQ